MIRDRLGGVPYETKEENGKTVIRFYPKNENARNPDGIVFVLRFDKTDKEKILKLLS